MTDQEPVEAYQYTTVEWFPLSRDAVSVEFYDGHGVQRVAGATIEVGR